MEGLVQHPNGSPQNEAQRLLTPEIPSLVRQSSLQDLIDDELVSRDDDFIEMTRLPVQADGLSEIETITTEASITEPGGEDRSLDPGQNVPAMSCDESCNISKDDQAKSKMDTAHGRTWKRLFKWKRTTSERPKVVYSCRRRRIFRHVMLVHFLPVAIIFTLLGLYVGRVLWTPPWPNTNVLNAFQFAAKVHESLMIASLVDIMLHHTRYRLLSATDEAPSGVPLGLVTSPFRLLDITYLWSRDFSAVCLHLNPRRRLQDAITVLSCISLFVLAAVVGPSSAVVMLPRLGEWELARKIVDAPFYSAHDSYELDQLQVYIGAPLADIFPLRITRDFIPQACDYSDLSLNQSRACPRPGLIDIVQGLLPPLYREDMRYSSYTSWYNDTAYNITLQTNLRESFPERIMHVTSPYHTPCDSDLNTLDIDVDNLNRLSIGVDTTTPTDVIVYLTNSLLDYYMQRWDQMVPGVDYNAFLSTGTWTAKFKAYASQPGSRNATIPWQQPYVSTICSEKRRETSMSGRISFDFGEPYCEAPDTVSVDAEHFSTQVNKTGMGFLDTSSLSTQATPSFTPSASFAFVSQTHETLCLVKANWVDFDLAGPLDALYWSWQAESSENLEWQHPPKSWFNDTNGANIDLDLEWLDFLDYGTGDPPNSNYSFFEKVRAVCLGSSPMFFHVPDKLGRHPDPRCMASGLAMGITEGLSKAPYRFRAYALGSRASVYYPDPPVIWGQWTGPGSTSHHWLEPVYWAPSDITPSQIQQTSTLLDFVIDQRVYGYGFHGVTITLAFIVLFLYVATVLAHVLFLLVGPSWHSNTWKSLGELLVLALRSPVPEAALENTGGGVEVSATWRMRVSVRELQQDNRVGIVLENDAETAPGNASTLKVRPDWKYS